MVREQRWEGGQREDAWSVLRYMYHLTLAVAIFMFGVSCYLFSIMVSHLNMCSVELPGVGFIIIEQNGIEQHG